MALSGFLSFIDSETALIFVILLSLAGLLFLYMVINKLKNIVPYIYPNARIRAKEAKFIQKDLFDEMVAASSLPEVFSILENTDYAEYLQNISSTNPENFEILIDSYLADVYHEIENIVPKKDVNLMEILMTEWDARNLKYVLRNLYLTEIGKKGMNPEDLAKSIVKSPLYKKILGNIDAQTIDELVISLDGTYFDLKDYLPLYRETKNLVYLENTLYKIVYERILNALPSNELEVKKYFTIMLEAENIKLLLRAKKDRISYAEIKPFLINGLFENIGRNFDEIDIDGIIDELDGTDFYNPLEEALFLAVKTAEAENVKKIISAKYFDLPSDRIRPLIVTTS